LLVLFGVASCVGCNDAPPPAKLSQPINQPPVLTGDEVQKLLATVEAELAPVPFAEQPESVIELPSPGEWTRTSMRSYADEDDGFSVGYEHPSGLTVTLYQYTRGHDQIPDDLNSEIVQHDMSEAKKAVGEAVSLGVWEAADEVESAITHLGSSRQEALWTRFKLRVRGEAADSEIFIWSHANRLFKVRATSHTENKEAFTELLTAIGDACQSAEQ
jgi:hypothetical protein